MCCETQTDMNLRLGLIVLAVGALQLGAQSPAVDEYQVKAAFLYNIAKARGIRELPRPHRDCIVGQNPFCLSVPASRTGFVVCWRRSRAKVFLTVGQTDDFTQAGGITGFRLEGTRVRIQIAIERAERMQLGISSKLLGLAKIQKGHEWARCPSSKSFNLLAG